MLLSLMAATVMGFVVNTTEKRGDKEYQSDKIKPQGNLRKTGTYGRKNK